MNDLEMNKCRIISFLILLQWDVTLVDTDMKLKEEPFPRSTPTPESKQKPQTPWACNQVMELITKGFSRVSEMIRQIHWD